MTRHCPNCNQKALPVLVLRNDRIRRCGHCSARFADDLPFISLIRMLHFFLVATVALYTAAWIVGIKASDMVIATVILAAMLLAWLVPAYAINRVSPIRPVADESHSVHPPLGGKKNKRGRVIKVIVALLFASAVFHLYTQVLFPAELTQLAKNRENNLPILAIALNEYRKTKGCYPATLGALLPDYIKAIPKELDPLSNWETPVYVIRYHIKDTDDACSASFSWRRCGGPDCSSRFDVETGDIWHDT